MFSLSLSLYCPPIYYFQAFKPKEIKLGETTQISRRDIGLRLHLDFKICSFSELDAITASIVNFIYKFKVLQSKNQKKQEAGVLGTIAFIFVVQKCTVRP